MVVKEGSNVTLKCSATGSPPPTIMFRREDGEPIKLPGGVEGMRRIYFHRNVCSENDLRKNVDNKFSFILIVNITSFCNFVILIQLHYRIRNTSI